jgi:hypothetical protein
VQRKRRCRTPILALSSFLAGRSARHDINLNFICYLPSRRLLPAPTDGILRKGEDKNRSVSHCARSYCGNTRQMNAYLPQGDERVVAKVH